MSQVPVPDAEAALRLALARDPHSAQAHYDLAYQLENDPARAAEAEALYRRASDLEPDNARYVYRRALVLAEQLQRPAEAESAYRRAIALAPDNPYYYGGLLSLLVAQARRPEALALAAQMRALLNAGQLWYGLATLDALLGHTEAALDHLRTAAREGQLDRAWARVDPDLAAIRDEPGFAEIVGAS